MKRGWQGDVKGEKGEVAQKKGGFGFGFGQGSLCYVISLVVGFVVPRALGPQQCSCDLGGSVRQGHPRELSPNIVWQLTAHSQTIS